MSKEITGRVNVWISPYSGVGPDDIANPPEDMAQKVHLYPAEWDFSKEQYTKIGTAEVVITLHDTTQIVGDQVASLQAQIDSERADSEARVTALKRRINELLALPMAAESA